MSTNLFGGVGRTGFDFSWSPSVSWTYSFIFYNELATNKLSCLNHPNLVTEWLCSDAPLIDRGRPISNGTRNTYSSQHAAPRESNIFLPVSGTWWRWAHCSIIEAQVRSSIECSTCNLAPCVKDEQKHFYENHQRLAKNSTQGVPNENSPSKGWLVALKRAVHEISQVVQPRSSGWWTNRLYRLSRDKGNSIR